MTKTSPCSTVCLKKRTTFISSNISVVTKDFHYFVGNKMACSNLPGKISLKLEMKSSRNGAFLIKNFQFQMAEN